MPRPDHYLSRSQRLSTISFIVGLHVVLGWGVLQIGAVRKELAAAAPMMFSIVSPERQPPTPPRTIPKQSTPAPVVAAPVVTPTADFQVEQLSSEVPPAESQPVTPPAPVIAPTAVIAPKLIPASAIEYRVPPPLEYPRASRKLRETGRTIIRVFVDESGVPRTTQVRTSSGFVRLDDAALSAVQKARFKPYMENGTATAGWALIPLDFELSM